MPVVPISVSTAILRDAGGEIAANLRKLYLFMNRRLSEANSERNPQMVREVIQLMEELNQSWKAITI